MSLIRRNSVESCQALNELTYVVEEWAAKNGDKLRRSCASCTYAVKEGSFKCALYGITPPIKVIVDGCAEYMDDCVIPF